MKKLSIIVIGLAVAVSAATKLYSAESAKVDVVMTITAVSVAILSSSFVVVTSSLTGSRSTVEANRIEIQNDGDLSEDYFLSIADGEENDNWNVKVDTMQATPGANEYRLYAIWHEFNKMVSTNTAQDYQGNDLLTGVNQGSTGLVFFDDDDDHAGPDAVGGFGVPKAAARNLFFRFDAPTSQNTELTSTAQVTVTASLSP